MKLSHDGRTALVTGAASGIGRASAAALQNAGAEIIAVDRDPIDPGYDFAHSYRVDITDDAALEQIDGIHRVDIVVNSAGTVGPNKQFTEVSRSEWEHTFRVNVTGTMNILWATLPGMRRKGWGRVVNIASIAGKEGNPNLAAYSASKGAVIAATKSLGKELATDGILVHSIAPAVIATAMNADTDDAVLEYMVSKIPMGRVGQAKEVANLVVWLTSEMCSFSTGMCHDISGGRATY